MMLPAVIRSTACLFLFSMFVVPGLRAADPAVDFVNDVRPILEAHCFDCHGAETREAGLRLDRRAPALAGSDSGHVIVSGKADESPLIDRLTSADDAKRMPPDSDPLPEEQIDVLRRWIADGAVWPQGVDGPEETSDHWSFQPVVRHEPPAVRQQSLVTSPVDAFVLARLEADGIAPSELADRYVLIKRLYYDLLGLPPEPEAVDRFVQNPSPTAYQELVDELLDSPHFGERWGRHWLDKARYADSDGYEKDRPRYNAWKFRDWVINAINDDTPFDQFTIEQLAGDLLPNPASDDLLATAFSRQTLTNTEGGTDPEQWRVEAIFDRVETLGTVWLGLTVGCARCHSHKFDPIAQREYYQLFAFFNNGDEVTAEIPSSPAALTGYQQEQAAFDKAHAELVKPLDEAKETVRGQFAAWQAEQRQQLAAANVHPAEFVPLNVTDIRSEGGATFEQLEEGSWLVTGERPTQDVYVLTSQLDPEQSLTGLKLEVLSHENLPKRGPGRGDNGNLVLSEITLDLLPDEGSDTPPQRVKFTAARAEFSQMGYDVAQAIDGEENATGWAISPKMGQDHSAVFIVDGQALRDAADQGLRTLQIRLSQQYDRSTHTIGRFRLQRMSGDDVESLGLPENIRKLLAVDPDKRAHKQKEELFNYFAALDPEVQRLQAAVDAHQKQAPFNPMMEVAILKERTDSPRQTHVLKRGDFLQPLGLVEPATLEALPELTSAESGSAPTRLDLARWLVSPENPLVPRVAVNHIWSHLFGRGLVKTVNDFGVRGDLPTHPELLDWLASEFIRLGWSRKALIRTIVLSHTYQQSSAHRPELTDIDPENTLLYRQNRFRVEAEIVRDLALAVSGMLEPRVGGPSVFPSLPPGIAELSYANNFKWGDSDWNTRPDKPHGVAPKDDIHRRGMYTFFKRTAAHPNLMTFDCPDANMTCVERRTSNTPLQALVTLNNDVFLDAARSMTRRVLTQVDTNDGERIDRAFQLCAVRPPENAEREVFLDLLREARDYYRKHDEEAAALAGDVPMADVSTGELAAWTATTRVLLNLDEFLTRE